MRRHGRRRAHRTAVARYAVAEVLHAAAIVMRLAEARCFDQSWAARARMLTTICHAGAPCRPCKARTLRDHARSLAGTVPVGPPPEDGPYNCRCHPHP